MTHKVFVDGRVRVCASMCSTCVFRPGNLMHLTPGRLAEMVAEATEAQSTIVCHATLDLPLQAACRGFFDRHATQPLQLADRLGLLHEVEPPSLAVTTIRHRRVTVP